MSFMRNKGKKVAGVVAKNKRKEKEQLKPNKTKVPKILEGDITSDSEEEINEEPRSDSDDETANEKRTRLANQMLQDIKEKVSEEHDEVSSYLKNELLEKAGRVFHEVADEFIAPLKCDLKHGRWGKLKVVTCVAVTNDNSLVFSASKDGTIVKWSLPGCVKVAVVQKAENPKKMQKGESSRKAQGARKGHFGAVNALAVSSDNNFLASGGEDRVVNVWEVSSLQHLHQFSGHRGAVMALAFQQGTLTLYSASKDRSIKLWNLREMAYVETLWGHEDEVTSLDALCQERVVSGGGRDGSVRLWRIPEESHLVFQAPSGCIDCVSYIDSKHFVSASNHNAISLWSTDKKKPLFTVHNAHDTNTKTDTTDNSNTKKNTTDNSNTKEDTTSNNSTKDSKSTTSTSKLSAPLTQKTHTNIQNTKENHTLLNGSIDSPNSSISNTTKETLEITNSPTVNQINKHMNMETDNHTDNSTKKHTDNSTNNHTDISKNNHTDNSTDNHTNKNISKATGNKTSAATGNNTSAATGNHTSDLTDQWICSLQALKNTNLFASGSRDGEVRLWKINSAFKSVQALFSVALAGFINSLSFSQEGAFVVAAVGQEHRMGRWFKRDKSVKNAICLIPLKRHKIVDK